MRQLIIAKGFGGEAEHFGGEASPLPPPLDRTLRNYRRHFRALSPSPSVINMSNCSSGGSTKSKNIIIVGHVDNTR